MRWLAFACAFCLAWAAALPASAQTSNPQAPQDPNVIAVPPAPAITAAPSAPLPAPPPEASAPPLGLVQTPAPAANADNGTPASGQPPAAPPAPDNTWLPGRTARIGVLNKVDGSVSELDIPVGGQANAGDLTLNVLACVNRPAGQIPDAAVFVNAQGSTGTALAPVYRGWMVRSAPGAAVVGDASETFRVIDCS